MDQAIAIWLSILQRTSLCEKHVLSGGWDKPKSCRPRAKARQQQGRLRPRLPINDRKRFLGSRRERLDAAPERVADRVEASLPELLLQVLSMGRPGFTLLLIHVEAEDNKTGFYI
jgi:hypothetical protein